MGDPATLPDLLRTAAAAEPDRVAVAVDGADALTYGRWQERSDAVGRALQQRGLRPGDRVALVFDAARWCDYAVAYLAVLKAAAVAVPLAGGQSDVELGRVLGDCGAAVTVAAAGLDPAPGGRGVLGLSDLETAGRGLPARRAAPAALAEILYEPRPLARPRAAARSHADLLAAAPWLGAAPAGPLLHAFGVGTLAGQDGLCGALASAPVACLVLPAFDPDRFCALLAEGRARVAALHSATAQALLDSGAAGRQDLGGVAGLVVTGGRAGPALLTALAAAFPRAALVAADVLGHGPAVRTVFAHDRSRPGAVGRPHADTAVWVADDDGRPAPAGEVGAVRVQTPAGTGEAATGAGDRGFVDEGGCVYLVAAGHEVVRCRGTTVAKAEVATVLGAHPAVADCAVFGVPDDRSATALAAALVLRRPATAQELRAWARDRLGDDRTPGEVFVVDALPRNPAGVLLQGRLRRRLGLASDDADAPTAPTADDAAVEAVTAAWRRVLDRRDVGPADDFFELGGDPAAAARVLALVADARAVRVPLHTFLASPTVAGLADAVARLRPTAPAERVAPVAFSQEGMLWHEYFAPGCQNLPGLARRYRGPLDRGALERSLDEIVRRHEPLRTTFALRDGRLWQVVGPHRPLHLPVRDLGELAPEERDAEVDRVVAEAGRRPFDLVVDAVFVPTLLRLADDDHVLVIRTHHSVFDDWSVGVFRRELADLYTAFAEGRPSPLPEPPTGFRDAASRQRRRLAGRAGTRELAFWRRELEGAPLTTQLPVDDPDRPAGGPQAAGQPVRLALPPELRAGLRALARSQRATVFMTMLAAYGVLVRRYTGQDDLLLSTVVANRNHTELEGLIGCFTKKVPLRLRLAGDAPFTEALAGARAALLGALAHQDLPFETVVQGVLAAPAATHGLVPHVALVFQGETPRQELALPGLDTAGFATSATTRRAHFMAGDDRPAGPQAPAQPWGAGLYLGTFVILSVAESADELTCVARGAFHAEAMRRLLDSYRTLLADVVADPTRAVSRLRLLDESGRAEALARGRGPAQPPPATTLPGAFHARVHSDPDAVAIAGDGTTCTYGELADRCDRLAARLQALGVGPGQTVGVALGPSPDAVVAVLAIWQAGAAWVGLDPEDDPTRLGETLRQASVRTVVGADPHGTLARHAGVVTVDGAAASEPAPADVGPEAAAVVYPGGSAGPGPVVLEHRSVLNLRAGLRAVRDRPEGGARRVCLSASPTEDGFLRQVTALLDGHSLAVPDRPPRDDPARTLALVRSGQADVVDCAADDLRGLLDAGLRQALERRGSGPEPVLVVGTRDPLDPETWATLRGLAGARTVVLYGPPECAFAATAAQPGQEARPSAGLPLANVEAHVLDACGQPLPPQASGQLHLGGPSLASGLADDPASAPEGTVDRTPGGAVSGLWATGQLARRLPDGRVELLGRSAAGADLRGFRVDPARIRSALVGCRGVRDVAVEVRRDERGDPRLVARIVAGRVAPSLAELRARVWASLPGYAWPAAAVVAQTPTTSVPAPSPGLGDAAWQARLLGALWAERMGAEAVPTNANYWQDFSFLEVAARARAGGLPLSGTQVTRNRTVDTLAADLAAQGVRDATGDEALE